MRCTPVGRPVRKRTAHGGRQGQPNAPQSQAALVQVPDGYRQTRHACCAAVRGERSSMQHTGSRSHMDMDMDRPQLHPPSSRTRNSILGRLDGTRRDPASELRPPERTSRPLRKWSGSEGRGTHTCVSGAGAALPRPSCPARPALSVPPALPAPPVASTATGTPTDFALPPRHTGVTLAACIHHATSKRALCNLRRSSMLFGRDFGRVWQSPQQHLEADT